MFIFLKRNNMKKVIELIRFYLGMPIALLADVFRLIGVGLNKIAEWIKPYKPKDFNPFI